MSPKQFHLITLKTKKPSHCIKKQMRKISFWVRLLQTINAVKDVPVVTFQAK